MTAEPTGAFDFGAAKRGLIGSPARSARVFLFALGSGTVLYVSISHILCVARHKQLDPCRLCPLNVGGGIALRELLADEVISARCFWDDI